MRGDQLADIIEDFQCDIVDVLIGRDEDAFPIAWVWIQCDFGVFQIAIGCHKS
jgi:hypothetical protein